MSQRTVTVFCGDTEIALTGEYTPGAEAYITDLPEDCDPGEAGEFEIIEATIGGVSVLEMLHVVTTGSGNSLAYDLAEEALAKLEEDGNEPDDE